jgi:transposase
LSESCDKILVGREIVPTSITRDRFVAGSSADQYRVESERLTERPEHELRAARKDKSGFAMTLAYPIVGIDISSTALDAAALDANGKFQALSCANCKIEARKLARQLDKMGVKLVVLEATGGYELTVMTALIAQGIPVARVNPRQVRYFAKGIGRLAKTDPIDARVLATFGERARPRVTTLPSAEEAQLKALALCRRQLVDLRVMEKNHRTLVTDKVAARSIETVITALDKQITAFDADIATLVEMSEIMRTRRDLLDSVPGLGPVTIATVIADLPELGDASTSVLKALVGVAPFNADSGGITGQRRIQGGRAPLRQALFMAARTAYRHNPVIRVFYERLRGNGKSHKATIIACIGKLVSIMNAIIKTETPFNKIRATGPPLYQWRAFSLPVSPHTSVRTLRG